MARRNGTFVCIICLREHRTLGSLLVCHGAGLRKVTGHLKGSEATETMLRNVLTNSIPKRTRERMLMDSGALSSAIR